MGVYYYVINIDRATAFELGKGPWSSAVELEKLKLSDRWVARSAPTPESLATAMIEWDRDVSEIAAKNGNTHDEDYPESYRKLIADRYREWIASNPGSIRFVDDTGTLVALDEHGCAYSWEDVWDRFTITGTRYKTD